MAPQKFSPLTFICIIISLWFSGTQQLTYLVRFSPIALDHQTLLASSDNEPHPLTPPGKPAPDDSASTGSST